jgi:hypothetical protein
VAYREIPVLCPSCDSAETIRTSEQKGGFTHLCRDCDLTWAATAGTALIAEVNIAMGHSEGGDGHIITSAKSAARVPTSAKKRRPPQ